MEFFEPSWGGLSWSRWVPLDGQSLAELPPEAGFYRVRPTGRGDLAYLGETGRNLRERVRALRRGILAEDMPFNDPHTAAPALWAFRTADGLRYGVSAAPFTGDLAQRKAKECFLLWRYRTVRGGSTYANHGRFHAAFSKSRSMASGRRGHLLPAGAVNPGSIPSLPPLPLVASPGDSGWMGLSWATPAPLKLAPLPPTPGVYLVLTEDASDVLYIGQTRSLSARGGAHRRTFTPLREVQLTFSALPAAIPDHQLLEIENDLIGGYFEQKGRPPPMQFGAHDPVSPAEG